MAPVITTPGVLRNVGLSCSPFLPPFSPYVSPPLSQTGHFPNFSLFLTIASWGTHPASNPQAPGSSTQLSQGTVRHGDLSTAVIIKLSMAVIVSIVSALPPCVRSVESCGLEDEEGKMRCGAG